MARSSSISTYVSCLLLAILSFLGRSSVEGSALTTTVAAGEKLCFYVWVDKPKEKVGFYFAVQSGGSFDIDWVITNPSEKIVIQGEKERQGDFVFTAHEIGEHSFCLNNDMSSFSERLLTLISLSKMNRDRPPLLNKLRSSIKLVLSKKVSINLVVVLVIFNVLKIFLEHERTGTQQQSKIPKSNRKFISTTEALRTLRSNY
ncbi:hypothetical protein KEM48_007079 [Puccinia striiformis f. sp. tritici PST-130]|nr:hypothetical protein KEM48_007079 [Puccinia striiformis f. sp. tritici PST-130]